MNQAEKKTKFQRDCEAIAQKLGTAVDFFGMMPAGKPNAYEDDGALHIIRKNGEWACFSIGQDTEPVKANELTRAICEALKIKVTERVLVEEDDEDDPDDYCPHCGREY